MKKSLILALFFSATLLAQNNSIVNNESSKFNIQVFGGLGIQTAPSEFTDYWRTGLVGGIAATVETSEMLSFRARADYGYHLLDGDKFADDIQINIIGEGYISEVEAEGGSIEYYNFDVDLMFYVFPKFYLVGGAGLSLVGTEQMTLKLDNIGVDINESDTEFGQNITLGMGYQFPINEEAYFFFEAKFNRQFFSDYGNFSTFPVLVGFSTAL